MADPLPTLSELRARKEVRRSGDYDLSDPHGLWGARDEAETDIDSYEQIIAKLVAAVRSRCECPVEPLPHDTGCPGCTLLKELEGK